MRVVATAGHVDHGKSTLVRALTGTDPDRWAEEHNRGLTIDLGFAHTRLASGETVAFVDVPGHQRFIANMLAGIGPAPAVLFVVAADEGWRAQSTEHLAAIDALGLRHGLLVVTRSDLADPSAAIAQAHEQLQGTSLEGIRAVAVSAVTGQGIEELRAALDDLCAALPAPDLTGRARLWVDRAFSMKGAGTVVTGTLEAGTLRMGDRVTVQGRDVGVRRLQSLGHDVSEAQAVARVAINLRGLPADSVGRGDVVLTGAWHRTTVVDARVPDDVDLPDRLMVHVGTAAQEARVRPLGAGSIRLSWTDPLPLQVGDRLVLRDPGRQHVLAGAVVLDVDPPELNRRGAARARAEWLADAPEQFDVAREVARRGVVDLATLRSLGAPEVPAAEWVLPERKQLHTAQSPTAPTPPRAIRQLGEWLIAEPLWASWVAQLTTIVTDHAQRHPLQARMPQQAAAARVGLPEVTLLVPLARAAGLTLADGHVAPPGSVADLGAAESGLQSLEAQLAARPFRAPERDELHALALGVPEIAAAVRLGRLLDLGDQIVLAPRAPALAMRELSKLSQPFTTSQARQALDTTRRVVIPLLEHLDRKGWTRRLDGTLREVARGRG
ncbi:selenocysteine-specific translation elongation factor [Ammonicoccus fulvus]|uniref:Selenocysteine-specific elongation factor n=1 Tax=Ammonicoccus fulvus TaxID=3138240 RepID=A0ABZ3FPT0_9ACTN